MPRAFSRHRVFHFRIARNDDPRAATMCTRSERHMLCRFCLRWKKFSRAVRFRRRAGAWPIKNARIERK
jgi:hypothetical protein